MSASLPMLLLATHLSMPQLHQASPTVATFFHCLQQTSQYQFLSDTWFSRQVWKRCGQLNNTHAVIVPTDFVPCMQPVTILSELPLAWALLTYSWHTFCSVRLRIAHTPIGVQLTGLVWVGMQTSEPAQVMDYLLG